MGIDEGSELVNLRVLSETGVRIQTHSSEKHTDRLTALATEVTLNYSSTL